LCGGYAILDTFAGRILARLVEHRDLQAGGVQQSSNPFGMTGSDDSGVGHEQNYFCSDSARQLAALFHAVDTENQPGAGFVVKRPQGITLCSG